MSLQINATDAAKIRVQQEETELESVYVRLWLAIDGGPIIVPIVYESVEAYNNSERPLLIEFYALEDEVIQDVVVGSQFLTPTGSQLTPLSEVHSKLIAKCELAGYTASECI